MEKHDDFKEVYFRYKQLMGEGFATKRQLAAAVDEDTLALKRERKRLKRLLDAADKSEDSQAGDEAGIAAARPDRTASGH
jgi:hypothetical protein